jgi:D-glycero-D-manno-heptose 1,7-bisphosphate phosphatase
VGIGGVKRAVFLDRDGTLIAAVVRNGLPYPPVRLDQVVILPGVLEAIDRLRTAGFTLVVVTNQPDVARGAQSHELVNVINMHVGRQLGLSDFRVCWHDDEDGCDCRKPKPGLILQAASEHDLDLSQSFVVGDRWRDVMAGRAAGCRTVLIDYGYQEPSPIEPDRRVKTLGDAVDWILAEHSLDVR